MYANLIPVARTREARCRRDGGWWLVALALAGMATWAMPSAAGERWDYFWYTVRRDFWRNNQWPQPFIDVDRQAAMAPMIIQVDNGWRMQNLIADHHFNPENQELNTAGREKIKWILTQQPMQRRGLYVQRGSTQENTARRIDSVQKLATDILPEGHLPSVEPTDMVPRGWPAEEVDGMTLKFRKTMPDPRLPAPKEQD
jgi:hypothetical protein